MMTFEEKLANLVSDEFAFPDKPPNIDEIISALEHQIIRTIEMCRTFSQRQAG